MSTSEVGVEMNDPAYPVRKFKDRVSISQHNLRAVRENGGLAVVLPPDISAVDEYLSAVAGLVLVGGPDVNPAIYGEEPHLSVMATDPFVDEFEIKLAQKARELNMPILAICRGMQVLNVSRGGTLHQHIPELTELPAHKEAWKTPLTHTLKLERSKLKTWLGEEVEVNSFHHQAISELGEGLKVIARAPDGIIEAVTDPKHTFCLGVQWHPELPTMLAYASQRRIYAEFLKACKNHQG